HKVSTVKRSLMVNNIEGLVKVGSVYTYTLTLPDGTGHEGQFELSLYYNSELYEEQADIYYSSDGEEWLVQNGTKEGNHITVSVDGFSQYGVLVPEEAAAVCEDEQTIQFGDTIEVCAGQKIDIADTLDVIVMPEDLPDDSTLTINDFSESAEIEELEQFLRCGGVYEVLLETPEATAYNEPFTMI